METKAPTVPSSRSDAPAGEMSVILQRLDKQFNRNWARVARIFGTNDDALRAWLGEMNELRDCPTRSLTLGASTPRGRD